MACAEESFSVRKVANQRAALLVFLKSLPAGSRIGMESTGSYHELLAELAHLQGFVVYVLNPKDTRHYAKALGLRAKMDRVDAQLIDHEHAKLHPWIPPTPQQRKCSSAWPAPAAIIPSKRPKGVKMACYVLRPSVLLSL